MCRVLLPARFLVALLLLTLASLSPVVGATLSSKQRLPAQDPPVDSIAVVVNHEVITVREVNKEIKLATAELTRQGIELPRHEVLQRQVLQRLILDAIQRQEASRLKIQVDNERVEQMITTLASHNRLSVPKLRQEVEKMGMTWSEYHERIQKGLVMDILRQQVVESHLIISNAEIDAFLKEQQRAHKSGDKGSSAGAEAPALVTLAQILVRIPESRGSSAQLASLRKKADALLVQVKSGANFASLAAASSEGPEALQGGMMGERPLEDWPDLFIKAIAHLSKGGVSNVIQSGNGFHILKVVDRRGAHTPASPKSSASAVTDVFSTTEPVQLMQTQARHILIKTSTIMTDEQARHRLQELRQRMIQGGEDFASLARRYSQDATAPQGGDLGWVNPDETAPAFQQAMDALKPGEISEPVHTQFGWHLIQVQKRRQKDMKETLQRMQARRVLSDRRAELEFQQYLEQLRSQAYIDNRLEKQSQAERGPDA
jgi:peptidyl-prolyl cis-trans isomerase SurA